MDEFDKEVDQILNAIGSGIKDPQLKNPWGYAETLFIIKENMTRL